VGIGAVKDRETRRGGEEDKMGRWKTPESPVLFFFLPYRNGHLESSSLKETTLPVFNLRDCMSGPTSSGASNQRLRLGLTGAHLLFSPK
jgi:hypothetical protein